MGRYISQPLSVQCKTIGDLRSFLAECRYVSDKELFGRRDYWQPPEDFERGKRATVRTSRFGLGGSCSTWDTDARFIGGSAGRYGDGHAWVEYFQDGKWFLLEPLFCRFGYTMPRLSTLRYEPRISVSWDGKTLRYFSDKKPATRVGWPILALLIPEYLVFWTCFWVLNVFRLPLIAWNILRKNVFRRELWVLRKNRER